MALAIRVVDSLPLQGQHDGIAHRWAIFGRNHSHHPATAHLLW
jgi:hypothetical protein